jgi:peptidoglycan-N-acetylglucosamine deacetylase
MTKKIKATFYIPGHTIDSFPEVCAEIRDSGHEIGHHGYLHESPVNLDEQHEREVIEKGLGSLQRIGVAPKGYRSPGWDLSPNSVGLLLEYGFVYDSSMMGADYQPYWCRRNDIPHRDRAHEWGEEVDLVEFPVSWTLDDFPQMEFLLTAAVPGLSGYDKTLGMWRKPDSRDRPTSRARPPPTEPPKAARRPEPPPFLSGGLNLRGGAGVARA